jgi:predicted CXXCH cytochrome family protein
LRVGIFLGLAFFHRLPSSLPDSLQAHPKQRRLRLTLDPIMPRIPANCRFLAISPPTISILLFAFSIQAQNPPPFAEKSCAPCHADIVRNYAETTMAKASGTAMQALIPGEFTHSASGVHYHIYEENSKAWLSFERNAGESLEGKRELLYFIGSGQRGRTYLFSEDGYAFESPVNWYAQSKSWDMTPAYRSASRMPLNLPAAMSCLHCHTSGFHAPASGTDNKYPAPLFTQPGISCERCHGDSTAHTVGAKNILNPDSLPPAQRDAICMQCHLEGNTAIEQPGKHLYDFKPGDNLSDFVHYLVLSTDRQANPRAVSQFEALAQSACKRKTGDAMHCTTCHDPHRTPSAAERVNYYRTKCITCHGEKFAQKHNPKNPDCTACHMPRLSSSDVAHTQATDHRILRRPDADPAPGTASTAAIAPQPQLERFPAPAGPPTNRDLVLGWLALAQAGRTFANVQEENLLPQTAKEYPHDSAILSAYAYRELVHKNTQHAKQLYESALQADPLNIDAAVNLGVLEAQSGSSTRALTLWRDAFERAPWRSSIGINLARLTCNLGSGDEAKLSLKRVLQFNPDSPDARQLLHALETQPSPCTEH